MKFLKKMKISQKALLILVVLMLGITVSSLTLASSSASVMRFILMNAVQSRQAETAAMKALRGEITGEEATIELSPTTLSATMLEILYANEAAAGGAVSLDDVSVLVKVGDGL